MYTLPIAVKGQTYQLTDTNVHGTMAVSFTFESWVEGEDEQTVVIGYVAADSCHPGAGYLWAWTVNSYQETFTDIVEAVTHVVDQGNVCRHGDVNEIIENEDGTESGVCAICDRDVTRADENDTFMTPRPGRRRLRAPRATGVRPVAHGAHPSEKGAHVFVVVIAVSVVLGACAARIARGWRRGVVIPVSCRCRRCTRRR